MNNRSLFFWWFNFSPANNIINSINPNEQILSQKIVNERSLSLDSAKAFGLSIPIGIGLPLFKSPYELLVETDKAYYIDNRLTSIDKKHFFFYIIWNVFYLVFGSLIIFVVIILYSRLKNFDYNSSFFIMTVLPLIYIISIIISFVNSPIRIIRKDWLTETNSSNNCLTIKGRIPENESNILVNDRLKNLQFLGYPIYTLKEETIAFSISFYFKT